ncbi:hypothetical protein ACI797_00455 [Geodermatophilus sp. SYSU D00691]
MRSKYMTGAKRIVALGGSSAVGVRGDDRPAGVAHAVTRLFRQDGDVALCGADVIPLPHHDWSQPVVGVLRCRSCAELAS